MQYFPSQLTAFVVFEPVNDSDYCKISIYAFVDVEKCSAMRVQRQRDGGQMRRRGCVDGTATLSRMVHRCLAVLIDQIFLFHNPNPAGKES